MARKPHAHTDTDGSSAWVVSHAYEGPNRRHRASLFSTRKVRLDDAGGEPIFDAESTDTTLRRLSLWAGLSNAARDQRAKFLRTLEGAAARGRAEGEKVWPDILDAVGRYLRAVGAKGPIDEPLVGEALHTAQVAHAEGAYAHVEPEIISRLDAGARGHD